MCRVSFCGPQQPLAETRTRSARTPTVAFFIARLASIKNPWRLAPGVFEFIPPLLHRCMHEGSALPASERLRVLRPEIVGVDEGVHHVRDPKSESPSHVGADVSEEPGAVRVALVEPIVEAPGDLLRSPTSGDRHAQHARHDQT